MLRKHLSVPGLLTRARNQFHKIKDPLLGKTRYTLVDCLLSGLALFGMKYPSLLKFDEDTHAQEGRIRHNLKKLYQVDQAPCDTYFRERLDQVEPHELQRVMNRLIAQLQRSKVLETYRFFDDYLLLSIDGTGYFSSHEVHCESCCVKHHRDETVTYYHQMLAAVVVHPGIQTVLPLIVEPIVKHDGMSKNDCEHNALKRLLVNLRRAHPHLKLLVTLDGLYADGVIIQLLQEFDIRFIITAKPADLKYLYEFYGAAKKATFCQQEKNVTHRYQWVNQLPLNDTHRNREVNLLCYEESIEKKGNRIQQHFSWITDLYLTEKTVPLIRKGGRARWKVENETFNTLKNQGYQFEHNFGHGKKQLSVVLAYLMFIAFLIDQIQAYCCKYFKAALKQRKRLTRLWDQLRGLFLYYFVDSWADLYTAIIEAKGAHLKDLLNTS